MKDNSLNFPMSFLVNMKRKDFIIVAREFLKVMLSDTENVKLNTKNVSQLQYIFNKLFSIHYPLENSLYQIFSRNLGVDTANNSICNVLLYVNVSDGPLSLVNESVDFMEETIEIKIMRKVIKILNFCNQNGEDPVAFANFITTTTSFKY